MEEQEGAEAQRQVAPTVYSSLLQNTPAQPALMQRHISKASSRWGTPEMPWSGLGLRTAWDPHTRDALGWSRLGVENGFGFVLG